MLEQESETTRHRALGDDSRARIVREHESADEALDANALARPVGPDVSIARVGPAE